MQKPFESLDLTSKYIIHDVPLYCHDHPTEPDGMNACVKEIETQLNALDLDTYPLSDGTNTVTAAELRDHLDNHPAGDTVGGYVDISSSRAVLASELEGHLLIGQAAITLTLPDVTTLPDNARCVIVVGVAALLMITPYDGGKSGADRILLPGSELSDGASVESSGSIGDSLTLRKDSAGWIAVQNTGFALYSGK